MSKHLLRPDFDRAITICFFVGVCGSTGLSFISNRFLGPAALIAIVALSINCICVVMRPFDAYISAVPKPMWAILVLGCMLVVSEIVSVAPLTTHPQVLRVICGIGVYATVTSFVSPLFGWHDEKKHVKAITCGLIAFASALALCAPFVVDWPDAKLSSIIPYSLDQLFPRLVEDTINSNVLAGVLAQLLPLACAAVMTKGLRKIHVLAGACMAVVIFFALILTQSRGAWLGAILGIVFLYAWRYPMLRLVTVAIIGIFGATQMGGAGLLNSVAQSLSTGGALFGAEARFELWTHAIYMIQDFAFTGVGMGNFQLVNERFYPLKLATPDLPHAHNLYLQIAVDLGIPGLIAWIGVELFVLRTLVRTLQVPDRLDFHHRALAAGLIGSQIALLAHGMLDAAVWGMIRSAPIVWAIWGLSVGLSNIVAYAAKPAPPTPQTPHPPPDSAAIAAAARG